MRFRIFLTLALAVLTLVATSIFAEIASSAAPNYGLNYPEDIAISGVDAFVTNSGGGSVTELNTATGALVRVLKGAAYKFGEPSMIVAKGADAFVGAADTSTITEFSVTTGALVRVIGGKSYDFLATSLAVDGPDVFVTNFGGGLADVPASVTEFNAATGALVRVISGASYDFSGPMAVTFSGADGFVVNFRGNSVTEFNVTTGALVRVISGAAYGLNWPNSIAISGGNAFVVNTNAGGAPNAAASPVTEFNAKTGAFEQLVKPGSYGFGQAGAVVARGADVFISGVKAIVELNGATGSVVHTMHWLRSSAFKGGELPAIGGRYLLIAGGGIDSVEEFNVNSGVLVLSITSHPAGPSA